MNALSTAECGGYYNPRLIGWEPKRQGGGAGASSLSSKIASVAELGKGLRLPGVEKTACAVALARVGSCAVPVRTGKPKHGQGEAPGISC